MWLVHSARKCALKKSSDQQHIVELDVYIIEGSGVVFNHPPTKLDVTVTNKLVENGSYFYFFVNCNVSRNVHISERYFFHDHYGLIIVFSIDQY